MISTDKTNFLSKKIKKEINKLEIELKFLKLINLKINTIKNIKISTRAMQYIAPYIFTAAFIGSFFKSFGLGLPFVEDTFQKNLKIKKSFDNLGNTSTEQQYDRFERDKNTLYYYSKWNLNENNYYSRTVETYRLNKFSEEYIQKLLENNNKELQDILGEPITRNTEIQKNIPQEELNKKEYIQILIYSEDTKDYIIYEETLSENLKVTLMYIILTSLGELITFGIRKQISDFNYSNCIEEIKRKNQLLNLDTITKKLELKKENYNRLMR